MASPWACSIQIESGRLVMELLHHDVSEVSVDSPGVIKNLGIVGVELVQCQRGFDGIGIAAEPCIGSQQLKAAHALHIGVRGLVESLFEVWQRFLKLIQFR